MFKNKAFKIISILSKNILNSNRIIFVSEQVNWVIKDICENVVETLRKTKKIKIGITFSQVFLKNKILHFATAGMIFDRNGKIRNFHPSNKSILTWYHFEPDDKRAKFIPEIAEKVDIFHTASETTKKELIKYGVTEEKIIIVPIGIDLKVFKPCNKEEKSKLRENLGIAKDKIVIGSFQKDGSGWGEGNEPKLIKGPDIFCDTVEELARDYDIHVLLTGPARGYVKKRLDQAGISYTHKYLDNYLDIVDYYHMLDLYIISSRVEGGPKAFLESMACKIPFVSTSVGMVTDIIESGINGSVVSSFDAQELYEKSKELLDNKNLKDRLIEQGFEDVRKYDWSVVADLYHQKLYLPLIK